MLEAAEVIKSLLILLILAAVINLKESIDSVNLCGYNNSAM